MLRTSWLVAGLGIVGFLYAGNALALNPTGRASTLGVAEQSLVIKVKPLSERQKCMALNRCRQKYTLCYDKLVAQHKNIEAEKVTCVKPYQKCINASFSGFDFFFTRWFNPSYLDCSKYPN